MSELRIGDAVTDKRPDKRRPFRVGRVVAGHYYPAYCLVEWPGKEPVRMHTSRLRLATADEMAPVSEGVNA